MTEQAQLSTNHFEHRLEFETVFSDLSSRFINLPPWKVDREIEDALRRVCELSASISRCFGNGREPIRMSSGPPTSTTPGKVCSLPSRCARSITRGPYSKCWPGASSPFLHRRSCRRRPPSTWSTLRLLGIKSNLTLPLSVGDERPVGALGLNALRMRRDWPDAVVNRLQLVGQVFTNALARKRARRDLRESRGAGEPGGGLRRGGALDPGLQRGRLLGHGEGSGDLRVFAGRGHQHGAFRGVGPSRRLGSRSGSHRAVAGARANPSTWSTGSSSQATAASGGSPPVGDAVSSPPASRSA